MEGMHRQKALAAATCNGQPPRNTGKNRKKRWLQVSNRKKLKD
jgi:hypothetical protein